MARYRTVSISGDGLRFVPTPELGREHGAGPIPSPKSSLGPIYGAGSCLRCGVECEIKEG